MKKNIFLMAAAATMFAACSQTDMVNEIPEKAPKAIEFDGAFVNKATRNSENSTGSYIADFSDHHNSFSVWGYKIAPNKEGTSESSNVFNEKTINVTKNEGGEKYEYEGTVYWDETASDYDFYAAAPADNATRSHWEFIAPTYGNTAEEGDPEVFGKTKDGYFKANIKLDTKLVNNDKPTYSQSLAASDGTNQDLMIAAPIAETIGNQVSCDFIHILSRLNIVVVKKLGMAEEVRTYAVEVGNLVTEGSFDESAATVDNTVGTNARWTLTETTKDTYSATKAEGGEVEATEERHVIQTLVIPQLAAWEEVELDGTSATDRQAPYLYVEYGVENGTDGGNKTFEHFHKYYNLANIFGITEGNTLPFFEGWQNTLTLTIGPNSIDFKARVANWVTKTSHENSLN